MRYIVYLFFASLFIGLVSCLPLQRVAREFSYEKQNRIVLLIPPSKSDVLSLYYPKDPYRYNISDSIYDIEYSRFLKDFEDSLIVDLFMRGLTQRLIQYGIRYKIPDARELALKPNEKAYMYSVAQMEMLEYIDTTEIKSDTVYITFPGQRYAHVYSTAELEQIEFPDTVEMKVELDSVYYSRNFARTNVVANSWLEFAELENPKRPMQVLFSMQYTSDLYNGYFLIEYPEIEVKFSPQKYMIYINDVIDLIYFAGYKNGEYIADHLFNIFLEERLGPENVHHYYKYDPNTSRARRAGDDRFIIMDP